MDSIRYVPPVPPRETMSRSVSQGILVPFIPITRDPRIRSPTSTDGLQVVRSKSSPNMTAIVCQNCQNHQQQNQDNHKLRNFHPKNCNPITCCSFILQIFFSALIIAIIIASINADENSSFFFKVLQPWLVSIKDEIAKFLNNVYFQSTFLVMAALAIFILSCYIFYYSQSFRNIKICWLGRRRSESRSDLSYQEFDRNQHLEISQPVTIQEVGSPKTATLRTHSNMDRRGNFVVPSYFVPGMDTDL